MKKIDKMAAPTRKGTNYPPPHDQPCLERVRWRLGDAAGLTRFGVNYLRSEARRLVQPAALARQG